MRRYNSSHKVEVNASPSLLTDLRTGLRTLAKRPLYSALCLATLGLGISTSVAMFAVVHAVLIRPLPVLNQNRLVFFTKHPRNDRQVLPFSYAEHTALRRLSGIVETSGGSQYDAPLPYGFRFGSQAFNVNVTSVTAGFFAPADMVPVIRRAIGSIEGLGLASAAPFDSFLDGPLAQPRLNALLLAVFACAAVVLAGIGLFGVMATMVGQRTHEFGVRMALGATGDELRRMVMRRGLALATAGMVTGLLGALLAKG